MGPIQPALFDYGHVAADPRPAPTQAPETPSDGHPGPPWTQPPLFLLDGIAFEVPNNTNNHNNRRS